MSNNKKYDSEISYIESVIYTKEYQLLNSSEQTERLKEALQKKFDEVFQDGIKVGENNIKSQINKLVYSK